MLGDKEKCYWMWKSLWESGFFTVMSIAPGVPPGKDLIRAAVTSLHTKEQLDRFGEALKVGMKKAGRGFGGGVNKTRAAKFGFRSQASLPCR